METAELDRTLDRAGPIVLENFKATVAAGQNALRAGILINGGAAVGLLTFLGSIVTKPEGASLKHPLSAALLCFGLGVLASAVAAAFVYLVQRANSSHGQAVVSTLHARKRGNNEEAAALLKSAEEHRLTVLARNRAAISCGVLSLAFFVAGLGIAFWAFWTWR